MKNILITLFLTFIILFNTNIKADPLTNLILSEGISLGIKVLDVSAKKISELNNSRKNKKKSKNQKKYLSRGSKIITFLGCNNLEPNYSSNTVFKIDLENEYIEINEGKKKDLIYFKINNILNSQITSTKAFTTENKKQKEIDYFNKYIDITITFDVEAKSIKTLVFLEPNAPKKLRKNFDKDIKKGKMANKTDANCMVIGERYLIKKETSENNKFPWTAQSKHPKSYKLFVATNLSTKKKAINLAMKKCYEFVTKELNKVGYNDCFLLQTFSTNSKNEKKIITEAELKKRKADEKRKVRAENAEKKARQFAEREGNEQWISDNKQNYLDQFNKKLNEYEETIRKIENERVKLPTKVINLKTLVSNNNIKVGNTITGLKNTDDRKIIELKKSIIKNKKIYLSSSKLNNYKLRLEYIEKIKFDDYQNYKFIKRLIVNANKSNKATDFVGKDGFTIKLPKILGGKEKKLTSNKIGFIKEFSNIRNRNLGLTFNSDKKILDKLNNDIENQTANIIKYVVDPINTITLLDEELSNRVDYFKFIRLNPYYWVFNSVYSLR